MKLNPNASIAQRKNFIKFSIQLARLGLGDISNTERVQTHLNEAQQELLLLKDQKDGVNDLEEINADLETVKVLLIYAQFLDPQLSSNREKIESLLTELDRYLTEEEKLNIPNTTADELEAHLSNNELNLKLIASYMYHQLAIYQFLYQCSELINQSVANTSFAVRLNCLQRAFSLLKDKGWNNQRMTGLLAHPSFRSKFKSSLHNLLVGNNNFLMHHRVSISYSQAIELQRNCKEICEQIETLTNDGKTSANDLMRTTHQVITSIMNILAQRELQQLESNNNVTYAQLSEGLAQVNEYEHVAVSQTDDTFQSIKTKILRKMLSKTGELIAVTDLVIENISTEEIHDLIKLYDHRITQFQELLPLEKRYLAHQHQNDFIEYVKFTSEYVQLLKRFILKLATIDVEAANALTEKLISFLDKTLESMPEVSHDNELAALAEATVAREQLPIFYFKAYIGFELAAATKNDRRALQAVRQALQQSSKFDTTYNHLSEQSKQPFADFHTYLVKKMTSVINNAPDALMLLIKAKALETARSTHDNQQIIDAGLDYLSAYRSTINDHEKEGFPTADTVSHLIATSYIQLNSRNAAIRCYKLAINNNEVTPSIYTSLIDLLEQKLAENTEEIATRFLKNDIAYYKNKYQAYLAASTNVASAPTITSSSSIHKSTSSPALFTRQIGEKRPAFTSIAEITDATNDAPMSTTSDEPAKRPNLNSSK